MSANSPLRGTVVTTRAISVAPMESTLDLGVIRLDPRRDTIDRWSAALARGDDAEVDRLVRQSRIDRLVVAASGQLGAMLGQAVPSAWSGEDERLLPAETRLLADVMNQIGGAPAD